MHAEATCEIPRRVTRQRGTQIIYVFFQIDPNVYELLLEIGHYVRFRQIASTAAQMGILQEF